VACVRGWAANSGEQQLAGWDSKGSYAVDSLCVVLMCSPALLLYCYIAVLPYCHTAILPYRHVACIWGWHTYCSTLGGRELTVGRG
jgi:hypothetical protein